MGGASAGGQASGHAVGSADIPTLDASGSNDLEDSDDILTFEWDFDNDGQYDDATGIAPTFSAAGLDGPTSRTVGVRVTDSGGLSSTDTATINVTNVPPTITNFTSSAPGVGDAKTGNPGVNVSASFTDPGTPDTHSALIHL